MVPARSISQHCTEVVFRLRRKVRLQDSPEGSQTLIDGASIVPI